jgi:hypothetical protein
MENITCGLTRTELDAHQVGISQLCPALKPDGTQCNCPYSAHSSAPPVQGNYSILWILLYYIHFTYLYFICFWWLSFFLIFLFISYTPVTINHFHFSCSSLLKIAHTLTHLVHFLYLLLSLTLLSLSITFFLRTLHSSKSLAHSYSR